VWEWRSWFRDWTICRDKRIGANTQNRAMLTREDEHRLAIDIRVLCHFESKLFLDVQNRANCCPIERIEHDHKPRRQRQTFAISLFPRSFSTSLRRYVAGDLRSSPGIRRPFIEGSAKQTLDLPGPFACEFVRRCGTQAASPRAFVQTKQRFEPQSTHGDKLVAMAICFNGSSRGGF
jgi:hypothetical protein